ncbi:MAG: hypothetical protein WCH62_05795 [Candidatus Omnitrophota bacterium]
MIKVRRKYVALKKMDKEEDNYVKASYAQRVLFVWELTQEVWSLKDKRNVQRRLQRHITVLTRRKG